MFRAPDQHACMLLSEIVMEAQESAAPAGSSSNGAGGGGATAAPRLAPGAAWRMDENLTAFEYQLGSCERNLRSAPLSFLAAAAAAGPVAGAAEQAAGRPRVEVHHISRCEG